MTSCPGIPKGAELLQAATATHGPPRPGHRLRRPLRPCGQGQGRRPRLHRIGRTCDDHEGERCDSLGRAAAPITCSAGSAKTHNAATPSPATTLPTAEPTLGDPAHGIATTPHRSARARPQEELPSSRPAGRGRIRCASVPFNDGHPAVRDRRSARCDDLCVPTLGGSSPRGRRSASEAQARGSLALSAGTRPCARGGVPSGAGRRGPTPARSSCMVELARLPCRKPGPKHVWRWRPDASAVDRVPPLL
jgi:hypothetical protein